MAFGVRLGLRRWRRRDMFSPGAPCMVCFCSFSRVVPPKPPRVSPSKCPDGFFESICNFVSPLAARYKASRRRTRRFISWSRASASGASSSTSARMVPRLCPVLVSSTDWRNGARQIPVLKVTCSNRVSVIVTFTGHMDGTPTGTASTDGVVADPRNGRLIKLLTPYSSRVVGNRLGARLANDSATFFGPPVR